MKCIILAAGYATRLYPLTENFPKPLLPVQNKPILDWLIDDIETAQTIDEYIVISNHKFARHFEDWAKNKPQTISVLDDGTETNETRLGAVKDIQFAIEAKKLDDDLLVIAGDNLLDFSLKDYINYQKQKNATCVMRYWEPDENKLRKTGVAEVDENDRIISMEEKPQHPKSNWCTPPFYIYRKQDIPLVKKGIDEGCGTDAPGSFIAWLSTQTPVHAYEMPGKRYDIGNLASYEEVQKKYLGIKWAKQT